MTKQNTLRQDAVPMVRQASHEVAPNIRYMIRRDMPEVVKIEQASYEAPWTQADFKECLSHHNHMGMVIESKEQIIGFMVYGLLKDSIHLLNIAICPSLRRLGCAESLVDKLKSKLTVQRRKEIIAYTRESNLEAQLFLRKMGFFCFDIDQDYYTEFAEPAYCFSYLYDEPCDSNE